MPYEAQEYTTRILKREGLIMEIYKKRQKPDSVFEKTSYLNMLIFEELMSPRE